jgi:hypothetical protein
MGDRGVLSICWLLLPIILILIGKTKGVKVNGRNKPWLYFCLGFSLWAIVRCLEGINIPSIFPLLNNLIYFLTLIITEIIGYLLIITSLLCFKGLTTKEGLSKLRGPVILIFIAMILWVVDSIYHQIAIVKNFKVLSGLFFTKIGFLVSGWMWGLMMSRKLLKRRPSGKVELKITKILSYIIFGTKRT